MQHFFLNLSSFFPLHYTLEITILPFLMDFRIMYVGSVNRVVEGFRMSIELKNEYGTIDMTNDVITQVVGEAAIECYGIVGMASQHQIRDGLTEILRKENFSRGVIVRNEGDEVHIDMYVIVSYGTKITEVAYQVQSKVQYTVKKMLGLTASSINIFVQGVRVTNV